MEYILRTFDLSKKYKDNLVLDKVNINIRKGDIYGFVGENGSGKTTVIRLISGLIFPLSGEFELFGVKSTSQEITEARKRMGAIVESPSIYLNMSAEENLKMQLSILGINDEERIYAALSEVGLAYVIGEKKKVGDFSLGMRQRLGIAMSLLSGPEFIILDEPMNGLDPEGIVEVRELILKLNRERGITFLISSHILNELSLVATRYGIISRGRLIKEISREELESVEKRSVIIETHESERLCELLLSLYPECEATSRGGFVRFYSNDSLNAILPSILDAKIEIENITCHRMSIEEYYLSLIADRRRGGYENA